MDWRCRAAHRYNLDIMEKMKIFVSWSGPRSAAVAEALKEYLPVINNAFDLWLSSDDIEKGSRSTLEIAKALTAAKAGIICLTPNNLTAPWILFEAGGIAKTVDETRACTILIDLQPSDVSKPLGEVSAHQAERKRTAEACEGSEQRRRTERPQGHRNRKGVQAVLARTQSKVG
jgi:hypothetical protein